jgi:hypothetical protein
MNFRAPDFSAPTETSCFRRSYDWSPAALSAGGAAGAAAGAASAGEAAAGADSTGVGAAAQRGAGLGC